MRLRLTRQQWRLRIEHLTALSTYRLALLASLFVVAGLDLHEQLLEHTIIDGNRWGFHIFACSNTFIAALTARVTALEGQRLKTTLDPNLSALDVDEITFDSNHFGKQYFAASKTLHVYTGSTTPTNTPY